jgi:hypothetical protein
MEGKRGIVWSFDKKEEKRSFVWVLCYGSE